GMNGYEVARSLRSDGGFRDVVMVALTGYGTDEDKARSFAAGYDHHLVKPINLDALKSVVGRVSATV
ncbi:MAG: hybrid sensor histidine kinase/response regulator, partial [Candidatus Binatia bacterium]